MDKFGILGAVQALLYAMLREELPVDGLSIILPDAAYDAVRYDLERRWQGYMVATGHGPQPGIRFQGVLILPSSDVTVAG